MHNIEFNVTDAASARQAIEALTFIAKGLDASFPATAIPCRPAAGRQGDRPP